MSEEQPLLCPAAQEYVDSQVDAAQTAVILDFEPDDSEDPRNWPNAFKWAIVLMLACMAFTV